MTIRLALGEDWRPWLHSNRCPRQQWRVEGTNQRS